MLSDFREIKPVVRKICREIDLKVIIPTKSKNVILKEENDHIKLK